MQSNACIFLGLFSKHIYGVISIRVNRISSRSQYAGDEAAAWFSTLLDKPGCKLYQLNEPRHSTQDTKWGDLAQPGDRVYMYNRPHSIYQYSSMGPRLSGQNCKVFMFLLSLNS